MTRPLNRTGSASRTEPSLLAAVASMLALDGVALRVIGNLEDAGIEVLLMKGPVTRQWLFPGTFQHWYTDVDLLVSGSDFAAASNVLAKAGFQDFHQSVLSIYRPRHERAWVGTEGVVDLHSGLWGIAESRYADAWSLFQAEREQFQLHGRPVGA